MSIFLRYLHHEMGLGIVEIHHRYTQYSRTNLYWHMEQNVEVDVDDCRHKNPGHSRKTTDCDCRQIIWTFQSLRRSVNTFSFTALDIQEVLDMNATDFKENCQTCPVWPLLWVPSMQKKGSPDYWKPPLNWLKFCLKCNATSGPRGYTSYLDRASWVQQDRSMPRNKDIKDLYVEKEWREHKRRIVFPVCQGQVVPFF